MNNTTNDDLSEIDQLLTSIRAYNKTIGTYEQHLMLQDNFTYSVKLTNGNIRIYIDELQDKQALTQDRLKDIARRFNEKK